MQTGTKNTLITILAVAGTVGSATAYLHSQINFHINQLDDRMDTQHDLLNVKMDTMNRSIGRIEGLMMAYHDVKFPETPEGKKL